MPAGKADRAAVGCGTNGARLELPARGEDDSAGELGKERSEPLTWSGVFILRREEALSLCVSFRTQRMSRRAAKER